MLGILCGATRIPRQVRSVTLRVHADNVGPFFLSFLLWLVGQTLGVHARSVSLSLSTIGDERSSFSLSFLCIHPQIV